MRVNVSEDRFLAWMRKVDIVLDQTVGMASADLPDWHYRTAFDRGVTPGTAAKAVLRDAGSF